MVKKTGHPANLAYLKSFWGKPVIIEPHRIIGLNFLRKYKRAVDIQKIYALFKSKYYIIYVM